MRMTIKYSSFSLLLGLGLYVSPSRADNPIVQTIYTADPAPMVSGDTVWLCASHDEDVTVGNFFTMNDWAIFSSKDMVNWTDHGRPISWETFDWASGNKSWAPHCVERDGRFYMYVPVSDRIGVAVADSPIGPWEDAIGAPLLNNYQYIDPSVFIDDDGQAYLYFGNPKLWYVRLNDDMISYTGGVQEIPMTTQSFGVRRGGPTADRPTSYEEGPWFYKRNDLYYMVYPTGELAERIAYSTSPGPTGPWTYGAEIMTSTNGHAFTNHPGVIDFKGRSYFFYHTQELPGGSGYKRSVAVEEFTYNQDGSIPTITKTSGGVTESVEPLIPYYRVEGETIAWEEGVEVEDCSEGGRNVSNIDNGDYIKVESVDFLTGALSFEASVASNGPGGNIELRLGGKTGTLIGTCAVSPTGGWQMWEMVSCDVSDVEGVHDLYLVFTGSGGPLFNLDWYQFTPIDPLPDDGTGGTDGMGAGGTDQGVGGSDLGTGGDVGVGGNLAEPGSGGATPGSGGATSGIGGSLISTGGTAAGTGGGATTGDGIEGGAEDPEGCACVTSPRPRETPWSWLFALGLAVSARFAARRRRLS